MMKAVSCSFAAVVFAGLAFVPALAAAPPAQRTTVYPPSVEGFRQQFNVAMQAYGNLSEGRKQVALLALPESWFSQIFDPPLSAHMAMRYEEAFKAYADSMEKTLTDFVIARSELWITEANKIAETADPKELTFLQWGKYTLKREAPLFRFEFTEQLNGREVASWQDTYVYEDGAFYYVGHGLWPLWLWPEETDRGQRSLLPKLYNLRLQRPGVNSTTYPSCLRCEEPKYTKAARNARYQGTVELLAVIGADGRAGEINIVRRLGLGLSEAAIEAVRKWKFKPALKDGKPIITLSTIEISFRLPN